MSALSAAAAADREAQPRAETGVPKRVISQTHRPATTEPSLHTTVGDSGVAAPSSSRVSAAPRTQSAAAIRPAPTSAASSATSSSYASSISSTPSQSSRSSVLSPQSNKLLNSVTASSTALTRGSEFYGRGVAPTLVNRSIEEQDLLNLTYGSQVVLRVSTGKFVALEEVAVRDRTGATRGPEFTVHAASPNAYPFTILNAAHLADRSEVKFQDSIALLAADGTFLSAEGAGAQTDDAPIGCHRRELSDVRTKWYLLCGHADLLGGSYARARGVVKIFDLVLLKSFMGSLLAVDEADVLGSVHHRERAPRPPQDGAAIPTQPAVMHLSRAHLPLVPAWLRHRGGSLSVSPPGSNLSVTDTLSDESKPIGDFNEESAAVQEQLLLEDLLFAFVGVEGKYIRLQQDGVEERVNFVTSSLIQDSSLVESVSRMLPLCAAYFSLQTYIQVHSRWEYGLVTHAFSAALRTILKEYLVLVAQLEHQFASGRLTMLRAWYYLQSSAHTLTRLDALCQRVNRTAGGTLLNQLHLSMTHAGDESTKALYTHLLVHASVPYFDMLHTWLTQGVLRDPYDEFQVKQHAERNKENVRTDFNDTYWDERYTVRQEKLPTFLATLSERVLTTGKYLNVIRECGRNIPSSVTSSRPLLHYSANERDYIDMVDSSYAFASRLLLDLLMHENDLVGRLRSIKRYFLGGQGDFFVHFMDTAATELAANTKDILVPRLRSHLELALRTSRASVDPYLQDLSVHTQPFTLVQQLEMIHSTSTSGVSGSGGAAAAAAAAAALKRSDLLKGHETIELSYRVRWPLSLVLSKKTLTKYQLLFRHLFGIKHAERSLNQCWATHQSLKELTLGRQYHHAFGLRHRMLHFFHSMADYIMVEVLEPNWHQLESSLGSVTTVDEVLRLHHTFLDTCLKQCLLTNQTLLKTINKLSITALFFAQHADTSINAHVPAPTNDDDSDSDEEEYAKQRRHASMDEDIIGGVTRRRPMSIKHRQKHVADSTYATLQSIQDEEHRKFIEANAVRFDNLVSTRHARQDTPTALDNTCSSVLISLTLLLFLSFLLSFLSCSSSSRPSARRVPSRAATRTSPICTTDSTTTTTTRDDRSRSRREQRASRRRTTTETTCKASPRPRPPPPPRPPSLPLAAVRASIQHHSQLLEHHSMMPNACCLCPVFVRVTPPTCSGVAAAASRAR